MQTNNYAKSREIFDRAVQHIPAGIHGHLGPSAGCFVPVEAYPFYLKEAKGAYFWDVDDNRFIDYMCAYGPIILGYANELVDEAYFQQARKMNVTTLPSPLMVDLADLLVETVASADWAFFAKNGADVTNYAVMIARAATGRKKIVKFIGGYHGTMPWMKGFGTPGTLEEDIAHVIEVPFNDLNAIRQVFAENPGEIACLIGAPYHHGNFADNVLPDEGYWQEVRKICTANSSLLIIDDVRAGFRLDIQGSDHFYGFEADLICFCKALANGYNISALCGKAEFKSIVPDVFYTGSYWLSAGPMAASLACITELRRVNAPEILRATGEKLVKTIGEAAQKEGFKLIFSGMPQLFYMRMDKDPSGIVHQHFIGECVKRGLFMTNHHNHFTNLAMTDEDIKFTGEVVQEACKALKTDQADVLEAHYAG